MSPPLERAPRGAEGGSLLAAMLLIARNLGVVIAFTAVVGLLAVLWALNSPRRYLADASFRPHATQDGSSRLAGLAAQFGVRVGSGGDGEPIQFYVELLRARELLRDVARSEYNVTDDAGARVGTIADLYEIEGESEQRRLQGAVSRLRRDISASANLEAGIVTVAVSAPWPSLAVQVSQRLLDLVNDFNLEKRQTQARAERAFVESRVDEARRETEASEQMLRSFIESNRNFLTSERLRLEYETLRGEVEMRRQVYASLVQAYEEARIEEVRNTPVITVIQAPEGSAVRADRPLVRVMLSLFFGMLLGVTFVFVREYLRRERQRDPGTAAELTAALRPRLPGRLRA